MPKRSHSISTTGAWPHAAARDNACASEPFTAQSIQRVTQLTSSRNSEDMCLQQPLKDSAAVLSTVATRTRISSINASGRSSSVDDDDKDESRGGDSSIPILFKKNCMDDLCAIYVHRQINVIVYMV
jgi:hypothetical protein